MYKVPLDLPKNCSNCPFGRCVYSKPYWGKAETNYYDGQIDLPHTHGYICEIKKNYDKVLRADFDKDIEKPDWCPLVELKGAG